MRIAYLDGGAGISGNMLLGALIDGGVPMQVLQETLASLPLDATLEASKVDRSGIHAAHVQVLAHGHPAEHTHGSHRHHHDEARSLRVILEMIEGTSLPKPVRALAMRTFELLGAAEAKIHQVPVEKIHFHEVGAVDAIADIVLAAQGVHALGVEAWHCAPLNVGGGTVQCAHGHFPVPAPATAELLIGTPTYSSGLEMELVTPTGAALVRALGCKFGSAPAMRVEKIGYGAGTRNPPGFANVLRLNLGETEPAYLPGESVFVLETAIDDLSPQVIAYVTERALALGALDVMCASVQMKKNRVGILITLLSNASHVAALQELLLRETTTLGVRLREERRVSLARELHPVNTPWGEVRIKRGLRVGEEIKAAPEFEDCRRIAEAEHLPLRQVMETAMQIYRQGKT